MRELKAKDLAPFTRILSKIGIKEIIANLLKNRETIKTEDDEEAKKASKERGREIIADLIGAIIDNYYKAEDDFFVFLSMLDGRTKEEIADLPIGEFISLITQMIPKDALNFLSSAAK